MMNECLQAYIRSRYDMLCFEGISLMLNIFRGKRMAPDYRLIAPPDGELQVIKVDREVSQLPLD